MVYADDLKQWRGLQPKTTVILLLGRKKPRANTLAEVKVNARKHANDKQHKKIYSSRYTRLIIVMSKKTKKLEYDKRGGVVVISRAMLESNTYESMPATAKALMLLLQTQWRNDRAISYGVREAAQKLGCTPNTASKMFKLLQDRGFIVCDAESFFNSRTGSKAREWRLTWMPLLDRKPTHDWEKWQLENKATVSK